MRRVDVKRRASAAWGGVRSAREWSGAFGDIGLLIPVVAALVIGNGFNATSVLVVFGLAYLLSALYYRLPMPVQPLKAMAAIAIAQGLGSEVVSAGAFLMAAVLIFLAATGAIGPVSRLFSRPVVRGIQAGVGVLLIKAALDMMTSREVLPGRDGFTLSAGLDVPASVLIAVVAVALMALLARRRDLPDGLVVLGFGLGAGLAFGSLGALGGLRAGPEIPSFSLPDGGLLATALVVLVIPQIPLTVGNAVVACTDTAHGYYGQRAERVTNRSLLVTMGAANVLAGGLGGMPVCHGSGGLTAHYRFGARTAAAGVIIGSFLLAMGLVFGSSAINLFTMIPYPVLGAMLAAVGAQHALLARDCRRPAEILVVALVVVVALATSNLALGFAAGMALYYAIQAWRRVRERSWPMRFGRRSAARSAGRPAAGAPAGQEAGSG